MTVPTNNEDRDATAEQKAWDELARLTSGAGPAANWRWSIPANPDRDSDLILAAGLKALADERDALTARRLPVSGDNAEWRDSEFKKFMSRGLRSTNEGTVLWHRQREAFNAAWTLASQLREVTPSDVDEVLAMLDGLNASGGIAYDDYSRLHDAVALLGPAEPVQVEVTDDMVERAAEGIARERLGRHLESLDDYWDGRPDAKRLDIDACKPPARAALVAALGGGDHAE